MSTEGELLKIAGQVGADAIEAYELLAETLKAANVIVRRYANREELIALDIDGALEKAQQIQRGLARLRRVEAKR